MQDRSAADSTLGGPGFVARLLGALVGCERNEVPVVLLLFAHSFCMGLTIFLFDMVGNVLFLASYGAGMLPATYLAMSGGVILSSLLYSKLEARLAPGVLFTGVLGFLLLAVLLSRVGLLLLPAGPVAFAMRVVFACMCVLGEVVFWTLAGSFFNLRKGKRLFPIIGAGLGLAAVLGGFSVPVLTQFLAVPNLLFLAVAFMTLTVVILRALLRCPVANQESRVEQEASSDSTERLTLWAVFKNRYLVLLLVVIGLHGFTFLFLDFGFLHQVQGRFEQDETGMAAFLGSFTAFGGVIVLLVRLFGVPWFLTRFGLKGGLLAMPLCLLVSSALLVLLGAVGVAGVIIFWVMVGIKFGFGVLCTIQEPSVRLLYQPLPAQQRRGLQAVVEGVLGQGSMVLASVLLLLATTLLVGFSTLQAMACLLVALVLWVGAAAALNSSYGDLLKRSLSRRSLAGSGLTAASLRDSTSRDILERWLASPDPIDVLYTLSVLGEEGGPDMDKLLVRLLDHPAAEVREETLVRIERQRLVSARQRITQLLETEPSTPVRGAAACALCALSDEKGLDLVTPLTEDPRPEVRSATLVGLLRYGGIEGVLAGGERTLNLVRSSQAEERATGALVLGKVGIQSFYRPLLPLLQDSNMDVRQQALKAAAKIGNPALCPAVLANLGVSELADSAIRALAAFGPSVIPVLETAFAEPGRTSLERCLLLRVFRTVGGDVAVAALVRNLEHCEAAVRHQALLALAQLGWIPDGKQVEALLRQLQTECRHAAWSWAALEDLNEPDEENLLNQALRLEIKGCVDSAFLLLSFCYPEHGLRDARLALEQGTALQRTLVAETLDRALPRELKEQIMPLVEDMERPTRLQRLRAVQSLEPALGREQRLRGIVAEESWLSDWTRACALYDIGLAQRRELKESVSRHLTGSDGLVGETAAWAHERLAQAGAGLR